MARGYQATLEGRFWKEHTCCYCGARYRYLLQRKKTGRGASQEAAANAATNAALRAAGRQCELRPCPSCGNYQPDMIGGKRFAQHARVLLFAVPLWLTLFVLGATEVISSTLALFGIVACAAAAFIAFTVIGLRNPNASLRTNKALADRLVGEGVLEALPAENDREERARPVVIESGGGFWLAFLLLGGTLLLMPFGELLRSAGNWAANPEWHPQIIGPGDSAWTWVSTDKPIESVRGQWRATGTGKLIGKDLGIKDDTAPLKVESRDSSWSADAGKNPSELLAPVHLWARVTFPTAIRPTPGRKKLVHVELNLAVVYPEADANQRVANKHETVKYETDVELATPRAGFIYSFFWDVASLGGGFLFLLAGAYHLARDRALKQCGLPTRTIAVPTEVQTAGKPAG